MKKARKRKIGKIGKIPIIEPGFVLRKEGSVWKCEIAAGTSKSDLAYASVFFAAIAAKNIGPKER